MRTVTATEAARNFSELLDAIEHTDETFVVTRAGKRVAVIAPAPAGNGRALLEFLEANPPDPDWAEELRELRASFPVQERNWPD